VVEEKHAICPLRCGIHNVRFCVSFKLLKKGRTVAAVGKSGRPCSRTAQVPPRRLRYSASQSCDGPCRWAWRCAEPLCTYVRKILQHLQHRTIVIYTTTRDGWHPTARQHISHSRPGLGELALLPGRGWARRPVCKRPPATKRADVVLSNLRTCSSCVKSHLTCNRAPRLSSSCMTRRVTISQLMISPYFLICNSRITKYGDSGRTTFWHSPQPPFT
jgi:hypothetical protein